VKFLRDDGAPFARYKSRYKSATLFVHEKTRRSLATETAPFRLARYQHRSSRCSFVSTCLKTRLELIKIHRNQSPADFSDTSTRGSIRKRRRGVCGYGGCIVSLEIKARRFDNLRYRAKRMGAAGGGRRGGWRARFAEEIKYYFPIKRYYLPLDGARRIT